MDIFDEDDTRGKKLKAENTAASQVKGEGVVQNNWTFTNILSSSTGSAWSACKVSRTASLNEELVKEGKGLAKEKDCKC